MNELAKLITQSIKVISNHDAGGATKLLRNFEPTAMLDKEIGDFVPNLKHALRQISTGAQINHEDVLKSLFLQEGGLYGSLIQYAVVEGEKDLQDVILDNAKTLGILDVCLTARGAKNLSVIELSAIKSTEAFSQFLEKAREAGVDLKAHFNEHIDSTGGRIINNVCGYGSVEAFKFVLDALKTEGLDLAKILTEVDSFQKMPLVQFACSNTDPEMLKVYLEAAKEAGLDLHAVLTQRGTAGATPLNIASGNTNPEVLKVYLEAAEEAEVDIVELVASLDTNGRSAFDYASNAENKMMLQSYVIVEELTDNVGDLCNTIKDYDFGLYIGLNGDVVAEGEVYNSGFASNLTGDAGDHA